MSADHKRLDALRRLAKDRAATPAEKATARRCQGQDPRSPCLSNSMASSRS
jgi:hypothetical protein